MSQVPMIKLKNKKLTGIWFNWNFADNENIEFGFESILSKNITHWDFDNQHSAKNKTEWSC